MEGFVNRLKGFLPMNLPNPKGDSFDAKGVKEGRSKVTGVDPTRSTGRRDSLLNGRKHGKRKCGLIFEFWKIRPKGGTVLLWSRHLLLSLFLNGENQVRTKNPNDSSMEKKRSAKTKFLGPGIRLPIRKVLHMR